MKRLVCLFMLFALGCPALAVDDYGYTSYKNSQYNYNNSQYNYQNSPYNYKNSPYNCQNSPYNVNGSSTYDQNGNRTGYSVQKTNGTGVNMYDSQGNYKGYSNY